MRAPALRPGGLAACAAFAAAVLAGTGCARAPQLAPGPIDLGPTPVIVDLVAPVPAAAGAAWDICLEFEEPDASRLAGQVGIAFVDTRGGRRSLAVARIDRRGERLVALCGRADPAAAAADTVAALELRSGTPLRLRGVRGGPSR